jgi:hypothetical protein
MLRSFGNLSDCVHKQHRTEGSKNVLTCVLTLRVRANATGCRGQDDLAFQHVRPGRARLGMTCPMSPARGRHSGRSAGRGRASDGRLELTGRINDGAERPAHPVQCQPAARGRSPTWPAAGTRSSTSCLGVAELGVLLPHLARVGGNAIGKAAGGLPGCTVEVRARRVGIDRLQSWRGPYEDVALIRPGNHVGRRADTPDARPTRRPTSLHCAHFTAQAGRRRQAARRPAAARRGTGRIPRRRGSRPRC